MPDIEYKVEIRQEGALKRVSVNGMEYLVDYNVGGDAIYSILMNHHSYGVQISREGDSTYEVKHKNNSFSVSVIDEMQRMRLTHAKAGAVGRQVIVTQMPGVIQKVYVSVGHAVHAGDPLCVLVAMKMENEIRSPIDGIVKEVYIADGDKVAVGDKMVVVE
jgi:biotin carboxyl carrier protein